MFLSHGTSYAGSSPTLYVCPGNRVKLRFDHAFLEIVEPNPLRSSAEMRERFFMQFAPHLLRTAPHNFAKGMTAKAQAEYI